MDQMTIDDVCMMVGRLYLENYRLSKQIPLLQEQIAALLTEAEKLKGEVKANVITVTPEAVKAA